MMLGHIVARRLPGTDLERAKALVRAGAVYMGHLRVRVPTARVATGERISVYPATEGDALDPLPLEAVRFVHREDSFVVLDKPAGAPVAATRENARGTLAEALRRRLEADGVVRPYVGIVHRLDRGASGLVLFTTRSIANKSVHQQFVDHAIVRRYRVLVHGHAPDQFDCALPLLELHSGTSKVAPGNPHARPAISHFRRLQPRHATPGTSLLQVELETGRHHQIRVHAAALGHGVVGDRRYGEVADDDGAVQLEGLHLFARELSFEHPHRHEPMRLVAPTPAWARAIDDEDDPAVP